MLVWTFGLQLGTEYSIYCIPHQCVLHILSRNAVSCIFQHFLFVGIVILDWVRLGSSQG